MTAAFVWLAVSAGLLSLLTPCVFPMVPITVAYFSGGAGKNGRDIRAALFFAVGIVATFTILGVLVAGIFGAAGLSRFAANPIVNLVFAALFLLFAANLFGAFELSLPHALLRRAHHASARSDALGALAMGAAFTLTSVTCTAPFVGSLLVLAAQGTWSTPIVGMLIFSVAFALPFFVLALAPRYIARLPRSGQWLRTVRILIGLLAVATAIKFLANADAVRQVGIFNREVVLLAWITLAILGAALLAIRAAKTLRSDAPSFVANAIASAGAVSLAVWLSSGVGGGRVRAVEAFLPPGSSDQLQPGSAGSPQLQWLLNDYPGALAASRATGKLVFVDFTGYTCTNCRWMEANVLTEPGVAARLQGFVLTRLYTDGDGERYERQQEFQEKTFGTVALPFYAVVDSSGTVRGTLSGLTRNPAEFIAFLERAGARNVASR